MLLYLFVFFKQKTAYEMRISDWSSDVCSSDLFIAQIIDGRDRGDRLGQRRHFRRRRQARAEHGILEVANFLPANDGDTAPDDENIVFGQLPQLLREHQCAPLFGDCLASIGEQSLISEERRVGTGEVRKYK